jgi:methyl-accepting chemotaxis protein
MDWIRQRSSSISFKLMAGFLSLVVLAGGMGLYAVSSIQEVAGTSKTLADHTFSDQRNMQRLSMDMWIDAANTAAHAAPTLIDIVGAKWDIANIDALSEMDGLFGKLLDSEQVVELDSFGDFAKNFSSCFEAVAGGDTGFKMDNVLRYRETIGKDVETVEPFTAFMAALDAGNKVADDLNDLAMGQVATQQEKAEQVSTALRGVIAVSVVVALAFALLLSKALAKPIKRAVVALQRAAEGDLTTRMKSRGKGEVAQLAAALDQMLDRTAAAIGSIGGNADALGLSSDHLSEIADTVGAAAEETSAQSAGASSAAVQVSANVQTVAVAAEEMTASIREIAVSVNEAARVASEAVNLTDAVN